MVSRLHWAAMHHVRLLQLALHAHQLAVTHAQEALLSLLGHVILGAQRDQQGGDHILVHLNMAALQTGGSPQQAVP